MRERENGKPQKTPEYFNKLLLLLTKYYRVIHLYTCDDCFNTPKKLLIPDLDVTYLNQGWKPRFSLPSYTITASC